MTDPGPLADREWRLVPAEARPGPVQMALEEVAARTAAEEGVGTVRVYGWEPSTLSLGYRQRSRTVDWAYCEREGIAVTRRPTGGGGIYHDSYADVSYSAVAPAEWLPGDAAACYRLLCEPLLAACQRVGVGAAFAEDRLRPIYRPACYLGSVHPAHDVLAGGRKISGNAQYRRRDAVIQHGSLSYDLRPERHLGVFADPEVAVPEFRERVTSVRERTGGDGDPVERETVVAALEDALRTWTDADDGEWRPDELEAARRIAERKYDSDRWVRDREDPLF